MSDVVENEAKMAYMKPSGSTASSMEEPRGPSKGFVVREAPWTTGSEKVKVNYCYVLSAIISCKVKINHELMTEIKPWVYT